MEITCDKQLGISGLRDALLNWYPFAGGNDLLLLGRNTKPLLTTLKNIYSTVDTEINTGKKYDCIVIVELLEEYKEAELLLTQLFDLLSDEGVLLLVFRNRFGIKYLCGGTDDIVKTPFSTLGETAGRPKLYARNEMDALLKDAGFAKRRYYYLMPDSSFVQAVYTDDCLPEDSIRDRVMPFDLFESPLVAWESDLYDDIVRERTLPHLTNAYLAECRKDSAPEPEKHVIYAALSTDRGEEHGFATVLYSDDTAIKKPLCYKGRKTLEDLFLNIETLRNKGLLTIPQELTSEGIEMPLMHEEALLHYLRRQLKRDPDDFMAVFSKIEADVMMSSELVNNLPANMSEIWGTDGEKLGPVLKTAWIDMIPYNAFWADGSIRYYDQEFAVENCPARYVLFRALFYTWIHIPEAESILPLETVKKQFELEELWDGFYRCEMKFVSENRNWSSLAEIYTHNYPDRDEIKRNTNNLMTSAGLREVHAVQLELLKELDRVCRKHQLKYMAIHGTLLGAVRHRGFVPWDDDVDVAMLRDDYERLISIADSGFSPSFFLQTVRNNFNCYYGGYCKLRRDGTAAYEPQNEGKTWNSCHQGIWIDIFPIDGCPVDNNSRERQQRTISFMQRIIYAKTYPIKKFVPDDVPGSTVSLYYILAKCTRRRWLLNWIDTLCRSNKDSPKRAILECYYGKKKNGNVWDAEAVGDTVEVPFEDMMIPVPAGWEQILRSRYGEDFMTPIAKKHRRGHKGIIFITDMEKEQNGYS